VQAGAHAKYSLLDLRANNCNEMYIDYLYDIGDGYILAIMDGQAM